MSFCDVVIVLRLRHFMFRFSFLIFFLYNIMCSVVFPKLSISPVFEFFVLRHITKTLNPDNKMPEKWLWIRDLKELMRGRERQIHRYNLESLKMKKGQNWDILGSEKWKKSIRDEHLLSLPGVARGTIKDESSWDGKPWKYP